MHWSLRCLAGLIVGGCFGTVAATVAGGLVGSLLSSTHPAQTSTVSVPRHTNDDATHSAPEVIPASADNRETAVSSENSDPPLSVGESSPGREPLLVDSPAPFELANHPWVTPIALLVGLATGLTFASAVWYRLGDVNRTPPAPSKTV
ncbi:MAG: hypothetical protein ACK5HA_14155 [Planctomycetaceae bacterium]|jgi:hypothetical protein